MHTEINFVRLFMRFLVIETECFISLQTNISNLIPPVFILMNVGGLLLGDDIF